MLTTNHNHIKHYNPPVYFKNQATRSYSHNISVPLKTTSLDALLNQDVVVLIDDENLQYSAKDLSYKVSYGSMKEKLKLITNSCKLHTFFSSNSQINDRSKYFRKYGFVTHVKNIEYIPSFNGRTKKIANSDNFILFQAGALITRSKAKVVIIASGDGQLVSDLSVCISKLPTKRDVFSMSLAGSTSHRLNASNNRFIKGNIEIGQDFLRPIKNRSKTPFKHFAYNNHNLYN